MTISRYRLAARHLKSADQLLLHPQGLIADREYRVQASRKEIGNIIVAVRKVVIAEMEHASDQRSAFSGLRANQD